MDQARRRHVGRLRDAGRWMFLPGMALSLALGAVARWLAAHVARKAAKQSYEALLRLHSMQLMWLISN